VLTALHTNRVSPRYSIVIPTYQRRQIVKRSVEALARLEGPSFEVIVVVDGSTDGTAEELRTLSLDAPLQVLQQPNAGAASARNRGAALAQADIILFLDDDMIAASDLLLRHDEAHLDGADAVFGHIPIAPDAPRNFLSQGVADWAEARRRRLLDNGGQLTFSDLLTGQLSVRRDVFQALGGFDSQFTGGGTFGREDTDFGQRLFDRGHRVVFAPEAVSWQYYAVEPDAYLRQWRQAGQADVRYVRKHPNELNKIRRSRRPDSRSNKFLLRPLARVPVLSAAVAIAAEKLAVELARREPDDAWTSMIFFVPGSASSRPRRPCPPC
jgi:glycosyltransferase involved in cell wall biosynthesis